jgi:hypothetical protein
MNIIEKKYYQFLDMQTLQHKQEKIIIQWINHLSTDPEHGKQSLGISERWMIHVIVNVFCLCCKVRDRPNELLVSLLFHFACVLTFVVRQGSG